MAHFKNTSKPNIATTKNLGLSCTLSELFNEGLKGAPFHLHLRRKAKSLPSGQKLSSVRGRGMEFFESRPYVEKDEIRHIDWKVSARLNGVYTKIFVEEKERPIYLAVDLRSPMFFGSRVCFKSLMAIKIAARLSFAALNGQDKIGGFIFTNDKYKDFKPQSTKKNLARFFGELAHCSTLLKQDENNFKNNNWPEICQKIHRNINPGSVLFLISDFHDIDNSCKPWLYRLRQKADVLALKISDPLEEILPKLGQVGMAYGQNKILFDSNNKAIQDGFAAYRSNLLTMLIEMFSALNIPRFDFSTNSDLDLELKNLFGGKW